MPITTYVPKSITEDYREQSAETQDVVFLFEDKKSGETKKLGAHKFVLALNSCVFKAQMYGKLKDLNGLITIVDSSLEGFKMFLDALYGKKPSWPLLNIEELLELNYLASKYLVDTLCKVSMEAISEQVVTKENLKEIFQHAETNSHLDEVAEELYKKCYDFYASLSAPDIADMMCHYGDDVKDVQLLIKMMAGFKLQSPKPKSSCKYCPCHDGNHVEQMTNEELAKYLRKGMKVVRGNDWPSYFGNLANGTVVNALGVNTRPGRISVKWDNGGSAPSQMRMGENGKYDIKLAP